MNFRHRERLFITLGKHPSICFHLWQGTSRWLMVSFGWFSTTRWHWQGDKQVIDDVSWGFESRAKKVKPDISGVQ